MVDDGGGKSGDGSESEDDSLLRAVARAPDRPPESPDPTRLAHFRILGRLGRGGMGIVYRAEDEKLRRTVALKVMPDTSGDDERRQRFLREARSAAAIAHPNVAVVHQVDDADGRVYIAMEFVDGENLRARLQRGRLDLAEAKELAVQIGRGLAAAHEKGIVHRDLKPENVMITPAGVVKLLDFGLAKVGVTAPAAGPTDAALAKTETLVTADEGRVMGTPDYMSPEQAFGEPVDVRSDVFSFGVLLYEMLSGARPFGGRTTGALLMAIASDPAPPLRENVPEVDEATAAIVTRCLAKKPGDRFATAGEVVAALEATPTRSLTDVALAARARTDRRPWTSKGVAAALAALGLLGLLFFARRSMLRPVRVAETMPAPIGMTAGAVSHSSNADAQSFFEAAMRSIHDDTPSVIPLLKSAVKADPSFGGAYLRLWWATRGGEITAPGEHPDEYYMRVLALHDGLSRRDRELFDSLDAAEGATRKGRLDAYLARYPDDDVAWSERLDGDSALADRALAADPMLVMAMADKAYPLREARRFSEAAAIITHCLELSPRSVNCTWERAIELDHQGDDCAAAEAAFRRVLDLAPSFREAHECLAGVLASRGASVDAVRDALGTDTVAGTEDVGVPEARVPWLTGDFAEVERVAREALAKVATTAAESEHGAPAVALRGAYTEAGDDASAAVVAADYLSRRAAWKAPDPGWVAGMVKAAVRGGQMSRADADRALDTAFRALVDAKEKPSSPADAWVATYAKAAATQSEAVAAFAKLAALGVGTPAGVPGPVLFLAGRREDARVALETDVRTCSSSLLSGSPYWARAHLYLGEIYEERGDKAFACGHYAKVVARWAQAKPRSVTADEARAHATKLGCDK